MIHISTHVFFSFQKIVFCDVTKENLFSTSDDEVVNYCQYFNDKTEEKFNSFDIIIASLVFDVVAVNRKMFKGGLISEGIFTFVQSTKKIHKINILKFFHFYTYNEKLRNIDFVHFF